MAISIMFKVRTAVRIVPSVLGDVPKSGHWRNHILSYNIGVILHVFQRKIRRWSFQLFLKYVPSALGDVPKSGHLRNHILSGNIGVNLHVLKRQIQKWPFQVF